MCALRTLFLLSKYASMVVSVVEVCNQVWLIDPGFALCGYSSPNSEEFETAQRWLEAATRMITFAAAHGMLEVNGGFNY